MSAFQNILRALGGYTAPDPLDTAYLWSVEADAVALASITGGGVRAEFAATASVGDSASVRTPTALSGKVYCEFVLVAKADASPYVAIGIAKAGDPAIWQSANGAALLSGSGSCGFGSNGFNNIGTFVSSAGSALTAGDRVGIAYDSATGNVWASKNGSWIAGNPAAGTGALVTAGAGTWYFATSVYTCLGNDATISVDVHPRADGFAYSVPSGFSAYHP